MYAYPIQDKKYHIIGFSYNGKKIDFNLTVKNKSTLYSSLKNRLSKKIEIIELLYCGQVYGEKIKYIATTNNDQFEISAWIKS